MTIPPDKTVDYARQTYLERACKMARAVFYERHPEDTSVWPTGLKPLRTSKVEPTTLRDMEQAAILKAFDECNGNVSKVAKRLGVGRGKIYNRLEQMGLMGGVKIIAHIACLVIALAIIGCSTPVFTEPPAVAAKPITILPPLPVATASTARSVIATYSNSTNGVVWLEWTPGAAPQTLVNLSNNTSVAVGDAGLARASGMSAQSVNAFVVTNTDGASNVAVGVAVAETNRIAEIGQIYQFPLYAGRTNYLVTSTNLVTWSVEKLLGTTGTAVFLVTNSAPARFYRVKAL